MSVCLSVCLSVSLSICLFFPCVLLHLVFCCYVITWLLPRDSRGRHLHFCNITVDKWVQMLVLAVAGNTKEDWYGFMDRWVLGRNAVIWRKNVQKYMWKGWSTSLQTGPVMAIFVMCIFTIYWVCVFALLLSSTLHPRYNTVIWRRRPYRVKTRTALYWNEQQRCWFLSDVTSLSV